MVASSFPRNLNILLMKIKKQKTYPIIGSNKMEWWSVQLYTMLEMVRIMLHAQNYSKSFWAEVMANAIYTHNWCPTRDWPFIIAEEVWSGRRPCIAYMRVFKCIAYAMVLDEKNDKLYTKDTKCLFFSYCDVIRLKLQKHVNSCAWKPTIFKKVKTLCSWRIKLVLKVFGNASKWKKWGSHTSYNGQKFRIMFIW